MRSGWEDRPSHGIALFGSDLYRQQPSRSEVGVYEYITYLPMVRIKLFGKTAVCGTLGGGVGAGVPESVLEGEWKWEPADCAVL